MRVLDSEHCPGQVVAGPAGKVVVDDDGFLFLRYTKAAQRASLARDASDAIGDVEIDWDVPG